MSTHPKELAYVMSSLALLPNNKENKHNIIHLPENWQDRFGVGVRRSSSGSFSAVVWKPLGAVNTFCAYKKSTLSIGT